MHRRCCRPATSSVHYTASYNTQFSAPEDGRNHCSKHVDLIGIINKPLLLHLLGCLYYLWAILLSVFCSYGITSHSAPPPHLPRSAALPPRYIPHQTSNHSVYTNVGSNDHVTNCASCQAPWRGLVQASVGIGRGSETQANGQNMGAVVCTSYRTSFDGSIAGQE